MLREIINNNCVAKGDNNILSYHAYLRGLKTDINIICLIFMCLFITLLCY